MSLTHSPVARRSTSFHASSITSIDRPANNAGVGLAQALRRRGARSAAVTCSASTNSTAADSSRGTLRVSKRDQRRVGGDGGLAVEQVGVGAVVDERRDPLGERAQRRTATSSAPACGLLRRRGGAAPRAAAARAGRSARGRRARRRRGSRPRAGCARARRGRRSPRRRGGRRPAARAARRGRRSSRSAGSPDPATSHGLTACSSRRGADRQVLARRGSAGRGTRSGRRGRARSACMPCARQAREQDVDEERLAAARARR